MYAQVAVGVAELHLVARRDPAHHPDLLSVWEAWARGPRLWSRGLVAQDSGQGLLRAHGALVVVHLYGVRPRRWWAPRSPQWPCREQGGEWRGKQLCPPGPEPPLNPLRVVTFSFFLKVFLEENSSILMKSNLISVFLFMVSVFCTFMFFMPKKFLPTWRVKRYSLIVFSSNIILSVFNYLYSMR